MSSDITVNMTEETKPKKTLAGHLKSFAPFIVLLGGLGFALSQGWHQYLTLEGFAKNIGWLDAQIAQNFFLVLGDKGAWSPSCKSCREKYHQGR